MEKTISAWVACTLACFALWAGGGAPAFGQAHAQGTYPDKRVMMEIGFAAGGATDVVGRALANKLSSMWGQQVVVENRTGAGGVLANQYVAKAAADGYTLLFTTQSLPISPSLYKSLTYDPLKDFTPLARVAEVTLVLVVNPKLPVHTVKELVDYARQHPGELNASSGGIGSATHLAIEQFVLASDINVVHVPYAGTAAALKDLIAGNVSLTLDSLPALIPAIKSGQLRALAVASSRRSQVLPDVPTISEALIPGYESSSWFSVFGPAHMSAALVQKIHDDAVRAFEDPDVQASLTSLGVSVSPAMSPEQLVGYMKSEREKYAEIIRHAGIAAQ